MVRLQIFNMFKCMNTTSGGIGAIQGAGEPAGEGEEGGQDGEVEDDGRGGGLQQGQAQLQ